MSLSIKLINSKYPTSSIKQEQIIKDILTYLEDDKSIDLNSYEMGTAQVIHNKPKNPSHITLRLFLKNDRTFHIKRIDMDNSYKLTGGIQHNYELTNLDHVNQPHHDILKDGLKHSSEVSSTSIFVSISPTPTSTRPQDQQQAKEMANFAKSKGLGIICLLGDQATTAEIIKALTTPNVVGCFYDGDANKQEIVTSSGVLSYNDVNTYLKGKLSNVTGIWLACNAYNDPMLSAMKNTTPQVYAAGITSLYIPSSDNAARKSMEEAIIGMPMKESFANNCLTPEEKKTQGTWGYYSEGSNYFASVETKTIGGQGGSPFSISGDIQTISFNCGDVIDKIIIGNTSHGGTGGSSIGSVTLDDGDYWCEFSAAWDPGYPYVTAVQLISKKGKKITANANNVSYDWTVKNCQLLSIGGRSGDFVDQLLFNYIDMNEN